MSLKYIKSSSIAIKIYYAYSCCLQNFQMEFFLYVFAFLQLKLQAKYHLSGH